LRGRNFLRKAGRSSKKKGGRRSATAEKVIGIIGGMGPEATIDLFQKIVKATPARMDQEHMRRKPSFPPRALNPTKTCFEPWKGKFLRFFPSVIA